MTRPVLVAGSYGGDDAGDEGGLGAVLQDMRALRPDLEVVLVSADPADAAGRPGDRVIAPTDFPAIIDAAQECGAILLAGGGIFRDDTVGAANTMLTREHAGLAWACGFPALAALSARPCMIYGAGVGPLDSEEGRRLTRTAFEQAAVATVRDAESRELLAAIGVEAGAVRVTADPAFTLRPDLERAGVVLSGLNRERGAPLVAACLRSWAMADQPARWEEQVARALDAFIEQTGASVAFVPFQSQGRDVLADDIELADRLTQRMAKAAHATVLRERHPLDALAGILARCDVVVGMQLRSVVFAANGGVPTVGIGSDPAVVRLMTRLGIGDYAVAPDALAQLGMGLSGAWANREAIRAELRLRSGPLRDMAAANARFAIDLVDQPSARQAKAPSMAWLRAIALTQTRRLAQEQARTAELAAEAATGAERLAALSVQTDALAAQVATLTKGLGGQLAQTVRRARLRMAPGGSWRDRAVQVAMRSAVTVAQRGLVRGGASAGRDLARASWHWLLKPRGVWALEHHRAERAGSMTLYTDRTDLFPDHRPRRPLYAARPRRIQVSLIATVRNERASVARWMDSLAAQTRQPDEVIIVDAGSADGTAEELAAQAARLGLEVTIVIEPDVNIARGRNVAIDRARGPVVAATDLGCRLTSTWLERIVEPFEDDEAIDVVAGWYVALERGEPRDRRRWPALDEVDPGQFLPSSRSIAFHRRAWTAAGGYPEWLTLTGEDTWFALELRRFCARWAFVPEAVVEWDAPATMTAYWQKIHAWSVGDGESGVASGLYWRSMRRTAGALLAGAAGAGLAAARLGTGPGLLVLGGSALAGAAVVRWRWGSAGSLGTIAREVGAEAARAIGFLHGAGRRREVVARRHGGDRGTMFILSGVPIDDTGGGARCTQLALELLKQGWFVVFLSRFPRHETRDLGLRIRHPRLLAADIAAFPWRRFVRDYARVFRERGVAAIVEFPVAEFAPLAAAIRDAGGSVVYDLLDRWDSALGGDWYSPEVERRIVALSDVLVATAAPLVARLHAMSGREVALVPNAVNIDLFDPGRRWGRPADYPVAPWSMIYVGALWGDWFDWALLSRLAIAHPDAAVVVIGDYRNQMASSPANMHFLGLKAQVELPAYLAHADVAIVPWKINAITHATSPLKVYEYLAMRRPVVAPRLDALAGIPGVLLSSDGDSFVRNVGRARSLGLDGALIDSFVRENSWPARIRTLLDLVAQSNPRLAAGPSGPDEAPATTGARARRGAALDVERA